MARAHFRSDAAPRRLARFTALCASLGAVVALASGELTQAAEAHEVRAGASAPAVVHVHPTWVELTPTHQQILAPLRPLWDTIPELNRRKWQRIADRYPSLKPEEQARLQERMAEWVKMTPQERRVARKNYQITRTVPAEKKADAWDRYQQLPEAQKKELAAAEKVPRRPGAVSGLPSGKRLPTDSGHQIRVNKPASGAAALPPALTASTPASPASAPVAAAPVPVTPATPPEVAASAPAAQPATESLSPPVTGEAATDIPISPPDSPRQ
jgi:hypothetical protein